MVYINRINEQGMTLIEYKTEYMSHHSRLIDNALIIALESLINKKQLDEETFEYIKKDSITIEELRKHLLLRKEYTKSPKELFKEFEKVRMTINNYLKEIDFTNWIDTESNVESNRITILKQYNLTKEFIMEFFGIDEKDMIQLMKKRGFVEKFAVLRMNKVFKEIYNEMNEEQYITQGYSLVYFNRAITGFSVDYKYHVNVDYVANEGNMHNIIKKIKEIDKIVERKFNKKMSINLYDHIKEKYANSMSKDLINDYEFDNKDKPLIVKDMVSNSDAEASTNIIMDETIKISDKSKNLPLKEIISKTDEPDEIDEIEEVIQEDKDKKQNIITIEKSPKNSNLKPIEDKSMNEILETKEESQKNEQPRRPKSSVYRPLDKSKNKGKSKDDSDPKEESVINDVDIDEIEVDEKDLSIDLKTASIDEDFPDIEFDIIEDDL